MNDPTSALEVAGRVPRLIAAQADQARWMLTTDVCDVAKLSALLEPMELEGVVERYYDPHVGECWRLTPAGRAALAAMEQQDA